MSEDDENDERAIVDRVARLQTAHLAGDRAAALRMVRELVAEFGLTGLANVLADRADQDRLVEQVDLFRIFGPDALGLGPGPRERAPGA
ncbi:hypothetical protein ACWDSJ_28225 [Nocardia sp. NPDC003482]